MNKAVENHPQTEITEFEISSVPAPPVMVDDVSFVSVDYLASQIDNTAADVYAKANRFSDEYKAREAAAIAFKSAGYKGEVSSFITSFASSAGLGNKEATDTILAQAEAFRGALEMLGGLRMQKFAVIAMTDLDAAKAKTDEVVAQIRAIGEKL